MKSSEIIGIKPGVPEKFDTTERVIRDAEKLLEIKVTDNETRKTAGSDRVKVNALIKTVDRKRIDLKKEVVAVIESEGQEILGRLSVVKDHLTTEITAFDAIKEAEKAEKMAAEKARTDAILAEITRMEDITSAAHEYGLPSARIQELLNDLESFPVKPEFFEEFTENTLAAKQKNIEIVRVCLDRTLKFEADQKVLAEQKAAQKAEAERLARIAAEQEKAKKEAEAEKYRADAEAQAKREADAAKLAQEKAKIEAEKAAIQAERERMAAEAEKAAFDERVCWYESVGAEWYAVDWDEAHKINTDIDIERAAMAEDLKPDKEKLNELVNTIKTINMPELKTIQAQTVAIWAINHIDKIAFELQIKIERLK